jgi:hypothetical protein
MQLTQVYLSTDVSGQQGVSMFKLEIAVVNPLVNLRYLSTAQL